MDYTTNLFITFPVYLYNHHYLLCNSVMILCFKLYKRVSLFIKAKNLARYDNKKKQSELSKKTDI